MFIPAGVTGTFVIKVKATNIAGDGVPSNANPLDQDFALVAYNATEAPLPVISGGATAILAESCSPPNNAIDPAETVTVNFDLSNIGMANTDQSGRDAAGDRRRHVAQRTAELRRVGGGRSGGNPAVHVHGGHHLRQTLTATFQLQDGAPISET